jgi:hypothetical protein
VFVSVGVPTSRSLLGEVVGCGSAGEPTWRVVAGCDGGACVQVARQGEHVMVRSSADPEGTRITLSHDEWQVFVDGVKAGDFDDF